MTMCRLISALLFLVIPLTAHAQQPKILSGDHIGFTRLVAPFPIGMDWKVVQEGRIVTFSIDDFNSIFDVDDVFEKIQKNRVEAITPQLGGFAIALGCDCRVAAFTVADRFVVIDVASPGIELGAPYILPVSNADKPALSVISTPILPTDTLPTSLGSSEPPRSPNFLPQPSLSLKNQDTLNSIQARLVRELGTAATRGVLSPTSSILLPDISLGNTDTAQTASPAKSFETKKLRPLSATPENSMRISSSSSIPMAQTLEGPKHTVLSNSCPTSSLTNISDWAGAFPFSVEAASGRRKLYQEFDNLDAKGAINLAKVYIYYGFGMEAKRVLQLVEPETSSTTLLQDISEIVEYGFAPDDSTLSSFLDCDTDISLWAILSMEDSSIPRSLDARAALLALNKLPIHLRRIIAPELSRRLLSIGNRRAAATALRNLERHPEKLPSSAKLSRARIELLGGNQKAGIEVLSGVVDDSGELAPEALISLVEAQIDRDDPIDKETARLIESYTKELQGSNLGQELGKTHVFALAKSGQFEQAFDAAKKLETGTDGGPKSELHFRMIDELTTEAEDVIFLDHILEVEPKIIGSLPTRLKLAISTRLLELGFPEQAQRIIVGIPTHPIDHSRQLLAARVALGLLQPMRALAELKNSKGKEANLLKARAKKMSGAYGEASTIYRNIEENEAALDTAWLADDLEGLSLYGDTVFEPILALIEADIHPRPTIDGMLARSNAVISESQSARQVLTNFLNTPKFSVDESSKFEK